MIQHLQNLFAEEVMDLKGQKSAADLHPHKNFVQFEGQMELEEEAGPAPGCDWVWEEGPDAGNPNQLALGTLRQHYQNLLSVERMGIPLVEIEAEADQENRSVGVVFLQNRAAVVAENFGGRHIEGQAAIAATDWPFNNCLETIRQGEDMKEKREINVEDKQNVYDGMM